VSRALEPPGLSNIRRECEWSPRQMFKRTRKKASKIRIGMAMTCATIYRTIHLLTEEKSAYVNNHLPACLVDEWLEDKKKNQQLESRPDSHRHRQSFKASKQASKQASSHPNLFLAQCSTCQHRSTGYDSSLLACMYACISLDPSRQDKRQPSKKRISLFPT
jgi:hypothetical protein